MASLICADTGQPFSMGRFCRVEILLAFGKRPFTPEELRLYHEIVAEIAAATARVALMSDEELLKIQW